MPTKEDLKTVAIFSLGFVLGIVGFWCWVWTSMAVDLSNKVELQNTEIKELKWKLEDMTLDRNYYEGKANEWFVNYVELGLMCGANE